MEKKHLVSLSFILSVLFHIVFGGIVWVAPKLFPQLSGVKKKSRTEIEFVDATKLLESLKKQDSARLGQIVEQDEHRINDEKPKDAKYLSRHDQNIVKETQARNRGKFKNSDDSAAAQREEKQQGKTAKNQSTVAAEAPQAEKLDHLEEAKSKDQHSDESQTTVKNDARTKSEKSQFNPQPNDESRLNDENSDVNSQVAVRKKPSLRDLIPSFRPAPPAVVNGAAGTDLADQAHSGGLGPSATDDHLKNVETGMQTMLSTREFVYYSYYNRIKEKLRQYWEPKIKEKMERIMRQGRTIASSTDRITRIVIVLDNRGTLVRVQIVGPSGVSDLDEAAVEAFRAAAPFPNPPKGIIENDGTVKIRWDFVLEA